MDADLEPRLMYRRLLLDDCRTLSLFVVNLLSQWTRFSSIIFSDCAVLVLIRDMMDLVFFGTFVVVSDGQSNVLAMIWKGNFVS